MHIRKERLLTLGSSPLYPPALQAIMDSDIHHGVANFQFVPRGNVADVSLVLGASRLVLSLAASGTGVMKTAA